jgi:dihydrofolate synthase/folylpolyglutamate synthase
MRFPTLEAWLGWQETLHPSAIDLGLERPGRVLKALGLAQHKHLLITVAGTNGKGSSVAMLEAILRAAGYRVGCYTSPHLLRYNERVRIDGQPVDDQELCAAFERIDQARGDTSITYFEFGTLAAFDIFQRAALDVAILEVGMGGRLDAVNLLDADVALITAIDIDHCDWLGDDRESIGREKAGIMRQGRPVVCSDPRPPQSIIALASELGAELFLLGRDFGFESHDGRWRWWGGSGSYQGLPIPALQGRFQLRNAAGVLMALACVQERLPVTVQPIIAGLNAVRLPGRFQIIPGDVTRILDVAHNPQAAVELAANLAATRCTGSTYAVIAMLADKDIASVVRAMQGEVDHWFVAGLDVPRGASAGQLAEILRQAGIGQITVCQRPGEAYAWALAQARAGDRLVIFGSFYTVADMLASPV